MTNEQKLREFAEKWCLKVIEVMKGDDYIMHDLDGCLSDLTALIEEHYYPKEFIVWKDANCTYLRGSGRYAINDYPKTVYGDYVPYTIDELLEHWKTNEQ